MNRAQLCLNINCLNKNKQVLGNTGRQDQLILATELLNKRLKEIKRLRCKNPAIRDKTPTLVDIERTHILFMNAHFKPFVAIGYEYQSIGVSQGKAAFGQIATYSIPQFGDFFHDMTLHIQLTNLTVGPASTQVRYCDFLGHRLLKLVQFEVNGNILDFYDSDLYNFHYNFFVPPNKQIAWNNCVGQEIPKLATLTQQPGFDAFREAKFILDGPQTPKTIHPVVDMWIPLLFWFNTDPRLMIPSVSIPYGQRFINVTFALASEICQGLPTTDFTAPNITVADLWINNIFVNPEIHDIFIRRIGFQMIRVHRYQRLPLQTNADQIRLDQLKWPVETLYLGVKPDVNVGTMEDWWKFHFVVDVTTPFPVAQLNPLPPPTYIVAIGLGTWKQANRVLDSFSLETHGVQLYVTTPVEFFNFYVPYNYGGSNITSPIDIGAYMVTFNLYPGAYQPSGHINLSNTREFFFIYNSAVLSAVVTGTLVVYAICINFLLVSDGSAVRNGEGPQQEALKACYLLVLSF